MEVTRQMVIDELRDVDEVDLSSILSYIKRFTTRKAITDFVIPTPRGNHADEYIKELRDGE